jgi:hypothetical protein
VTRGLPFGIALLTLGCVGPNPRWDGPDDAAEGDGDSSTAASGSTASDEADAEDGTDGGDDMSSTGIVQSNDTGEGPMCMPEHTLCNGMCKDTSKDRHACGVECLDCAAMLGMQAECKDGECRPDNSGPGGGEEDD